MKISSFLTDIRVNLIKLFVGKTQIVMNVKIPGCIVIRLPKNGEKELAIICSNEFSINEEFIAKVSAQASIGICTEDENGEVFLFAGVPGSEAGYCFDNVLERIK